MPANWSAITFLAIMTGIAAYTGRCWFRRWFNPLSLYSAIWGFCLFCFELKLIQYYPISVRAWACIILAWASLFAGAGVALVFLGRDPVVQPTPLGIPKLRTAILALCALGGLGVFSQILVLQREFGNLFVAIFVNSMDIYIGRTEGTLTWLPYIGASLLAASALAGTYAAKTGHFSWPVVLPLILMLLQGTFAMTRLGFLMCVVLFLSAYLHTPGRVRFTLSKVQLVLAIVLLAGVSAGGVILVSSTRSLAVQFPGQTDALDSITEYIPPFPSFYSNFSAPPVAFSLYLGSPEESRRGFWGEYTFAPLFRLLSKFGLSAPVPWYEENYYTPVPVNTSTYLKNVYSDFGLSGIICFPLVLGLVVSWLIVRPESCGSLLGVFILAYLYLIIIFSFMFDLMVTGDWFVSIAIGTMASWWAQRPVRAPAQGDTLCRV